MVKMSSDLISANFNLLKMVHTYFCFSILFFISLAFFLRFSEEVVFDNEFFLYITPVLSTIIAVVGYLFYRYHLRLIHPDDPLLLRLQTYKKGKLVEFASFELAAILPALITISIGNIYFLIISVIAFLILLYNRPELNSFYRKTSLNTSELNPN